MEAVVLRWLTHLHASPVNVSPDEEKMLLLDRTIIINSMNKKNGNPLRKRNKGILKNPRRRELDI